LRRDPPILKREYSLAEVEKEYSRAAWIYDLWANLTETKAVARSLELANVMDGERVLEVAVGTGLAFKMVVDRNRHGRNEGIDISPRMLSAAIERMRGYDDNSYRLQVGDARALPFDSDEFDLVINHYMLDLFPEVDFVPVLDEFFRVLRPSGRLVLVTMAFGDKWYNGLWLWIAKYFPTLLTNCRPVSISSFATVAGFKDLEVESVSQNTVPSQVIIARKP
jgi:ubiquinone/menaquinone biosynthesis C-methylase UbiE